MNKDTENLLSRVETLSSKIRRLGQNAMKSEQRQQADYAGECLGALAVMITEEKPIFHSEPWHRLADDLALSDAGEMLLRLKSPEGRPLPPYPAIMTFYGNGLAEELDTILCLCALDQFRRQNIERQVSVNISSRTLQNRDFVETILAKLEAVKLSPDEKIILEIHESNAALAIDESVIDRFRAFDVKFAIDDVGVSANDVFRFSACANMADFIKLDRAILNAHSRSASLKQALSLIRKALPGVAMVAEGVKNAEHAREALTLCPELQYVQGMHLPDRETFRQQWKGLGR